MKKNNDKKKSIILAGIGLFTVLGGTLAYFTTSSNIVNKFESGLYQNRIVEEFESPNNWVPGTTTKKEIRVENTGDVSMALRASIVESWVNKKGNNISLTDDNGNIAAIINYGSNWDRGDDGYFDYKDGESLKELLPGSVSDNFIESVTFNGKTLATAKANNELIAKWGYVTENEECQGDTGKTSSNTTSVKKSTGLRDDAQIRKYNVPDSVVKQALSVAKEGKSDKENLRLIYEWCNHHIGYYKPMYYSTRYGAAGTLKRRSGNCCDNAHVMIAMARSVGIKARYAHAHHGKKGHVWGEYYVNGSWFTVDTGTGSTTKYWGGHSNYAGSKTANYDKLPF